MAIETKIIRIRRGLYAEFAKEKMLPGELAVATDKPVLFFCWKAGEVIELSVNSGSGGNVTDEEINRITQELSQLKENVESLKQSASSGKTNIAGALTGIGVPASDADTFLELAGHISGIGNVKRLMLQLVWAFDNEEAGSGSGSISIERASDNYAGSYSICFADENDALLPYYDKITELDITTEKIAMFPVHTCYSIPKEAYEIIAIKDGTVEARYKIPDSKRIQIQKKFSFGLLSDIHVNGDGTDKAHSIEDVTKEFTKFTNDGMNFVIISGDITQNGLVQDVTAYNQIKNQFSSLPVYCCRGNHDTYNNCTINYWTKNVDPNGLYYEIDVQGDKFLFLGMVVEDISNPFSEYSLRWLETKLEEYKNQRVFVVQHVFIEPCGNPGGFYPFNFGMINTEGTTGRYFRELMRKYQNAVFISGHSHFVFEMQDYETYANIAPRTEELCHRIHVPSGSRPRNIRNGSLVSEYEMALGYEVDVYDNFIILKGIDFVEDKMNMTAQYYLNTVPIKIGEDSTGEETTYPYLTFSEFAAGTLENDGSIRESTSTKVTDYILLNDNPSPSFRCNGRVMYLKVCYYDGQKNFLEIQKYWYDAASSSNEILTLTKPIGAKYIRVSGQLKIEKIEFNGMNAEPVAPSTRPPIVPYPSGSSFPPIETREEPQDKYEKAKWKAVNFIKRQMNTSGFLSTVEFLDITVVNQLTRPGVGTVESSCKLLCGNVNSLYQPALIQNKYISVEVGDEEEYIGTVKGKWYETLLYPENYRVDVYVVTDGVYYVDSCNLKEDYTWETSMQSLKGIKHVELVEKASGLIVEYGRPYVDNYTVRIYTYADAEYLKQTCKIFVYNGKYYFFGHAEESSEGEILLGKVIYCDDSVVGVSSEYKNISYGRLPSSYLIPEDDPNYSKEGNTALGQHAYMMNSRSFVYDAGLCLLVFTLEKEYELCKEILNRIRFEQKENGSWNFSYDNYIGQLYEDYVRTGSIGWLIWGACFYAMQSTDTAYNDMLEKAGQWLLSQQVTDSADPRYGLLRGGIGAYDSSYNYSPDVIEWCSTEHNCSALQGVRGLYNLLKDEKYKTCAELMFSAVQNKLYDTVNGRFYQGISQDGTLDDAWAIDCLTWAGKTSMIGGDTAKAASCMNKCIERFTLENQTILVSSETETYNTRYSLQEGITISGFKPYEEGYNNPPQLIWSEGTLGAAALLKALGRTEEANNYIDEIIKMQDCNGSSGGVVYTSATRASLPWEFHVWESVVGSAWLYLALQEEDVFFI